MLVGVVGVVTCRAARSMAAMAFIRLRTLQFPSVGKHGLALRTRLRAAPPLMGFELLLQSELRAGRDT